MADDVAQLVKLCCMLTSPYDQEVLTAARMINAKLVANDWTWDGLLANGAGANLTEEQLQRVFSAGLQKGEQLGYQRGLADGQTVIPKAKAPSIELQDDVTWLTTLLQAAQTAETDGFLDAFEIGITGDYRDKLSRFGRRTYLSQAQFSSFKRLEAKLTSLDAYRFGYLRSGKAKER